MPTISVVHSTVAEVIAGVESEKSISPGTLKEALTSGNMYGMNFASVTGSSLFGDGSNLTGLIAGVSGSSSGGFNSEYSIVGSVSSNGVVTLSAKKIVAPKWYLGSTGKPLYQETGSNRISQAITKETEFREYLNYIRSQNPPLPGIETVFTPAGIPNTYPGAVYSSGVIMLDGRLYMVPDVASAARIYDPSNNTLTTPAGVFPTSNNQHVGGTLLPDGRIFLNPYNAPIRIYNPASNALTTPITTRMASNRSALLPDGRVYMIPNNYFGTNITCAIIYDPVTNTLTTPTGFFPTSQALISIAQLFDGRLYIAPGRATTARIYNPFDDTLSTPGGIFPVDSGGNYDYLGAVTMLDGRVYVIPDGATRARIYDPVTNTLTTPTGIFGPDINESYEGGCLLPDGRVFCAPAGVTIARIYNPTTDTLTTPGFVFPGINFSEHSKYLGNGLVYIIPDYSTIAYGVRFYISRDWDTSVITSPFFNGAF